MDNSMFDSAILSNIKKISREFETITRTSYDIVLSESYNSMIKEQSKIFNIDQIQLDALKHNSSIFESVTQNLFKDKEIIQQTIENLMNEQSNQFLKNNTQLFNIIRQSFNSINKTENTLGINTSVVEIHKNFIENLNNFSKELYIDNKLDFNIKYEDIEEINKKIQNSIQLEKKDLVTFDKIISIISLLFAFYVYYFPDDSESIKIQQMIKSLDNKISKSLKQEQYYEVTKNTNVREQSNTKSKKLTVAYPKQKLLIIENKPFWLQVEYFDEKRNETIIGWVSKKSTKRLD